MKPILGPHSGPKEALLSFAKAQNAKRLDQVNLLIEELFAQTLMDGFLIGVQSALETGNWSSPYWEHRLNPAGIGLLGGLDFKVDTDLGYTWKDGRDSARGMLIHHCAYTGTAIPAQWQSWTPLDPRYKAVFDVKRNGTVRLWSDYGNGNWAADTRYSESLANRERLVRASVPMVVTPTVTPKVELKMPVIIDKYLHIAQHGQPAVERRNRGRGGMTPKVIFIHIQQGTSWGSWEHFHKVSASSTVFTNRDGSIWRIVPEEDAPWTNGDVNNATAKGLDIISRFGRDPNQYALTIEAEGYTSEPNLLGWKAWPKPQLQLDATVWQVAEWMRKYNIPLSLVLRHADVNQVDRPYCPGDDFYNYVISRLSGRVVAPPVATYAKPLIVNDPTTNKPWDGSSDITVNDALFHSDRMTVTSSSEGVNVRQWATVTALPTRAPLNENQTFSVLGWVNGEKIEDEQRWWITGSYSRVWVGATKEKPTVSTPTPELPDNPKIDDLDGPKIINGIRFYDVGNDGLGRNIQVKEDANLRKYAGIESEVVGEVKTNEVRTALYWVIGQDLKREGQQYGENIWWVLQDASSAPTDGPRLWAGNTHQKPF